MIQADLSAVCSEYRQVLQLKQARPVLENCTPPPSSSWYSKARFEKKSVLHEERHYVRPRSQPARSGHALNNTQGPLSPKPTKQRQRPRWRGNANNWIFSRVVHRAADCYGTHVRAVLAKTLRLIRKERRDSARGTDSDRRERRSTSATCWQGCLLSVVLQGERGPAQTPSPLTCFPNFPTAVVAGAWQLLPGSWGSLPWFLSCRS